MHGSGATDKAQKYFLKHKSDALYVLIKDIITAISLPLEPSKGYAQCTY